MEIGKKEFYLNWIQKANAIVFTYRISSDDMYAGVLNKIAKKSKTMVRLGRFSSTIIACSNSVIIVVFNRTRTMSVSLHTSFRISVNIVTTIGAFWCVSRRWADKKLFIIFSKINCSVDGLLWRAHVINGFEIVFWTVICKLGDWQQHENYFVISWKHLILIVFKTHQSKLWNPFNNQIRKDFLKLSIGLIVKFLNTAHN